MAIKINYINCKAETGTGSAEIDAAKEIGERFQKYFDTLKGANGQLTIFASIKLYGYPRNDFDIVVIGDLNNCHLRKRFNHCKKYNKDTDSHEFVDIDSLLVDSFICIIELKDFKAEKIWKEGTHYWGNYQRTNNDEDITDQADEQKYSMVEYLHDTLHINPYVLNSIYFRAIDRDSLNRLRGCEKDIALPSDFDFEDFVKVMLLQTNVKYYKGNYHLACFNKDCHEIEKLTSEWRTRRTPQGVTRTKFEAVTNNNFNLADLQIQAGDKFSILSGRAGTGKTVKLLQLAFHLANEDKGNRCLLLTYNHALVSDIRRLIDFSEMPSGLGDRTVDIQTRDSFFVQLMQSCDIVPQGIIDPDNFDQIYNDGLKKFYNFIVKELSENDIDTLKELTNAKIDWDYILVDEAQDWESIHRDILFKIYGSHKIIVADGVDQFICSYDRLNWDENLNKESVAKPKEMVLELREKANIVRFVNDYAQKQNIKWHVKPNPSIPGGTIKIYREYNTDIHIDLLKNCEKNGCEKYDILILFPPCDMKNDKSGFRLAEAYAQNNINIFDGSRKDLRRIYPSVGQSRVFQYDSCRGLEGWCVVCTKFDELIKYKLNDANLKVKTHGLDTERAKKDFVNLWSLMPLTRAIDTLIITLNDPNSEVGEILYELSLTHPFVEWYC